MKSAREEMLRILSIDDARSVHAFLADVFSDFRLVLDHAYDGRSGLKKALEQEVPYDLVLLDWEMPGMTGPEVLSALKAENFSSPIIMLTSKNEAHEIGRMLESGAAEYVMKPFTPEILIGKIEMILGKPLDPRSQAGN